jgi:hypothetical protein
MADAYATTGELEAYLGSSRAAPTDAGRLLVRASEVIDALVTRPFAIAVDTGLPTDPDQAAALRDACCAMVEFWMEVGEENDIDGLAGTQVQAGGYSGLRAPANSVRAIRILRGAGLL